MYYEEEYQLGGPSLYNLDTVINEIYVPAKKWLFDQLDIGEF